MFLKDVNIIENKVSNNYLINVIIKSFNVYL
jgi:hypothetical protein